jgi:L,D-transpeptidase ErfK/SrfK
MFFQLHHSQWVRSQWVHWSFSFLVLLVNAGPVAGPVQAQAPAIPPASAIPALTPANTTPASPVPSTANFVSQDALEAARQLVVTATLGLPGLGHADLFLPIPDPLAQVRLVIKLGERRVYLYDQNQVKTSFPVAIGRDGWETPTGTHRIIQMQHDPIWQHPFTGQLVPPGSDNPLGARWIGFWTDGANYIGFHGTPNEDSVGRPASHGCVRMFNRDVIKLFEMVRIGTPVEVVP